VPGPHARLGFARGFAHPLVDSYGVVSCLIHSGWNFIPGHDLLLFG